MADKRSRAAERRWKNTPGDREAAEGFLRQLFRQCSQEALIGELADLLSGRHLDLRHLLMNRSADSYGFWGMVEGVGFKITVARWSGEGWSILKHYGDQPVVDDGSMGPDPPHVTQILTENMQGVLFWRRHDEVPDDDSELDYDDVYDAIRDALNLCDGRVRAEESDDPGPDSPMVMAVRNALEAT